MQRPIVRFTLITAVLGFIIFGVLFIGVQASNHIPWYVSFPLLVCVLLVWLLSEFTDG